VGLLVAVLAAGLIPLGFVLIIVPDVQTRGVLAVVLPAFASLGVGLSTLRAMRSARERRKTPDDQTGVSAERMRHTK
jgi:hypothetical protein